MKRLSQIPDTELTGKRVLLRADFNVPLKDGKVSDDTRIRHTLPTIKKILNAGGSVAICSHMGRPGGKPNLKFSLQPVATHLSALLGQEVIFYPNPLENKTMNAGDVILLQNTRFLAEETENSSLFAGALARGCDLFVNDAFGTVHRAHASTVGAAGFLPHAAGLLLEREVEVLSKVLKKPDKPLVVLVGGAKMKTKIGVLEHFVESADTILVGGGIANTFLSAQGKNIGDSLFEPTEIEHAKKILAKAKKHGCEIILPVDAVVAQDISENAESRNTDVGEEIKPHEKILDIGEQAIEIFVQKISAAAMLVWNGPVGLFELTPFANGTKALTKAAAEMNGKAILGGGDTLEAIARFGYEEKDYFHLSTGGGAMLEYLEGKELPGISALK